MLVAAAAVVVAIVVVITVAIVGLLLVLLLRFSFGWHIFHGYDLLVVQGCWLEHPTEAAAQLHSYYSNNNSSRTSAQFVVAK